MQRLKDEACAREADKPRGPDRLLEEQAATNKEQGLRLGASANEEEQKLSEELSRREAAEKFCKMDPTEAADQTREFRAEGSGEEPRLASKKVEPGLPAEALKILRKFDKKQFIINEAFGSLEEAFDAGPGHLDLFSGQRGFPRALVKAGCPWALCFDLKDGESQDLLRAQLQLDLRKLLSLRCFRAMAAGPVCASFSTAITPPWRTLDEPRGRRDLGPLQRAKLELGHKQLLLVLSLVRICIAVGVIFFVENPDGSWIWKLDQELSWDDILQNPTVGDFRVDQCRFGTPWRKRTRFRTNCQVEDPNGFYAIVPGLTYNYAAGARRRR